MPEYHRDDDKTRTHVPLLKDTMVGHYRIVEKIGAGGMGEVYLAEDTELDRKVALKFLPIQLCPDEECRARFKREAQAAAKLDHPNIVTVHEVGEYQGRPYFSMAHVEGQSLREFSSGKDLSIEQILELGVQICEGLQAAHDKGIIHRDIKPSNILIDSSGRARIVDFGLASVVGTDQLTKTGSTLGTIGYMSPEQVCSEDIDHRSDLFSLGVVLYELITKKNPFKRDSEAATLKAVCDDLPEPLARFKMGLPDGLQVVIDKALEKDVRTRYQHADGMLSDLMRVKRSLESGYSTTSLVSPTSRPLRWPWMAAAMLAVSVVVVLLVARQWHFENTSGRPDKIMLAILPFENLGAAEDEFFADGITDEITSRLARVNGLGVIARMSAMRYKGTDKTLRQVGKELGVDYVLAGSVRWQKLPGSESRVRVSPQLIRTADESNIWTDIYDEVLTDVFTVQAKMAKDVVTALNISLVDSERRAISSQSTTNLEAYNYYLRGRAYWEGWEHGREDLDRAAALLEKAIALDSTFADAYAELSGIHSWYYETGYDQSEARKRLAWENATLARKYDSLDAYSRVAWGYYYYYVLDDYPRALKELEQACLRLPNSSETLAITGYVKRRVGQWEESFELQKRAEKLNPFNFWILYGIIEHCFFMRLWDDAEAYIQRARIMFPDHARPYCDAAMFHLRKNGDYRSALQVLDSVPAVAAHSMLIQGTKIACAYFARDYDKGLRAVKEFHNDLVSPVDTARYFYLAADLNRLAGNKERARLFLDSALIAVERVRAIGIDLSAEMNTSLGQIYADLGRDSLAIKEAIEYSAAIPISRDAVMGTEITVQLAKTYTRVGEVDRAVDLLDTLLSIPSDLTVAWLRGHPDWDPLRDHARFRALMKKYETKYEI